MKKNPTDLPDMTNLFVQKKLTVESKFSLYRPPSSFDTIDQSILDCLSFGTSGSRILSDGKKNWPAELSFSLIVRSGRYVRSVLFN